MNKSDYPKVQNWLKYRSLKTQLDCEAVIRDGEKCIICGGQCNLEVHHIVPGLETLENLMTLCHRCHKVEHGMSGCFSSEHHEGREKTKFRKGQYFNRWTGEWVGK